MRARDLVHVLDAAARDLRAVELQPRVVARKHSHHASRVLSVNEGRELVGVHHVEVAKAGHALARVKHDLIFDRNLTNLALGLRELHY